MNTRALVGLAFWLAVTFLAAWIGSRFTPGAWYTELSKPAWTPPSWLFGPVWTALYIMMAVAVWLVWLDRGLAQPLALQLFGAQLVLNAAWSWLFFGRQAIGAAAIEIIVLEVLIIATAVVFWRIRPLAGALMIPYALWVAFASALNWAIWMRQR